MNKIYDILKDNQAVKQLLKGKGNISAQNISEEAYLLASGFFTSTTNILVIKPSQHEANLLYQFLKGMEIDGVLYFPVDESQRVEALAQSPELQAERINTLYELKQKGPHMVITHNAGMTRLLPPVDVFHENCIHLQIDDEISKNELVGQLVRMGYQYSSRVDQPFFYSSRGGIIDIYSIQYDHPIRIEFFDDFIDSIRFYDKNSQRKIESINEVTIIPASDILYRDDMVQSAIDSIRILRQKCVGSLDPYLQEELDSNITIDIEGILNHETSFNMYKYYPMITKPANLVDYIGDHITLVSPLSEIEENYLQYVKEIHDYSLELYHEGKCIYPLTLHHDLKEILANEEYVNNELFSYKANTKKLNTRMVNQIYSSEDNLVREINSYLKLGNKVLVVFHNEMHLHNMYELFERNHLKYTIISESDPIFPGLNVIKGKYEGGIELLDEKIVVLTELELYGRLEKKKPYIRYKNAQMITSFNDLNVGDYVVHDDHGIGQYMGIKTLEVSNMVKDYLHIAYQGNERCYVPVEQFQKIRKYVSKDGRAPHMNKLGGTDWAKTKRKIRNKVDGLADELIKLYAKRSQQVGFAFSPDNSLMEEFEQDFPYDLTPDQEISIREIKEEMEMARPMDKLLCGDVGFGKTEVALRAAFKAILDHKQVAILCPTTILSNQHYRTIQERFKNFPVNFALLNRFVSAKETKRISQGLNDGAIDLVVGTHKVLNNAIQYKDLGLLIIDEEQRFGVRHKEKIKELKNNVDVLTLTATPIPRTLQMSLMGIRSLSTINTPPSNRLPVQTYVVEKSDVLIKQVIERELARNGQVFYLYNNTMNIESVAFKLENTIPGCKVGVGHGQMDKNSLDDVMEKFLNKEYNVLVCTTIIETGIDIPNANTLIVEDADKFGLAQLYQIKGRVGRSDRNAYAYLLYRREKQLTEEATKRLKAIKEFTQLGDGYKIASRDLSIRGAGDILGGVQSGFIEQIGFDMYMKILQEAIDEKQGVKKEEIPITSVSVDAYIPENYVNTDMEKLGLYQTVQKADTLQEIAEIRDYFLDVYGGHEGKLPRQIESILQKRIFDILMVSDMVKGYTDSKNRIIINFTEEFTKKIDGGRIFEMMFKFEKTVRLSYTGKCIQLTFNQEDRNWLETANYILLNHDLYVND